MLNMTMGLKWWAVTIETCSQVISSCYLPREKVLSFEKNAYCLCHSSYTLLTPGAGNSSNLGNRLPLYRTVNTQQNAIGVWQQR